jgi:pSer/pThr/pTyr-binding forkhead associated (FHA) protein
MHLILVSIPNPVNNTPVLRALEYVIIILLWLFFMWVVRAVWVEVKPLQRRQAAGDGGAPRRRKGLRLHVVRPEDHIGRTYELDDEVTVGRAAGCGVSIDYDTYASNLHARLFRQNGTLWVEDLGSTNGTWVNTRRIGERTQLDKGDLLQVGGTVFEIGK